MEFLYLESGEDDGWSKDDCHKSGRIYKLYFLFAYPYTYMTWIRIWVGCVYWFNSDVKMDENKSYQLEKVCRDLNCVTCILEGYDHQKNINIHVTT